MRFVGIIMVLAIFLTGCDIYRSQKIPEWQAMMATGYDPTDDPLSRANPR